GLGLVPGVDDRSHVRGESGRRYLAPESREEWNRGPTRATHRGAGPHTGSRSVSPPRWRHRGGVPWPLLTFRRTNHDHAHEDERAHLEVHAVADAAEAGPGRPGPARICSSRRG